MLIQCTKKLLDQLEVPLLNHEDENPFFSWHANLLTVKRRKMLVLVNDQNRYIAVIWGLKSKDFKQLNSLIIDSIRNILIENGFRKEAVDQYLNLAGEIVFAKTKNKTMVARMNLGCRVVQFFEDYLSQTTMHQTRVSMKSSYYILEDESKISFHPIESFVKDLATLTPLPIIACKMMKIKISLNLEKQSVWRRLVVPYFLMFNELHDVIQEAFNWGNEHLHKFSIIKNDTPFLILTPYEESLEFQTDVKMILENGVFVKDYLSEKTQIIYTYDFGDNWEHLIEIEELLEDYPVYYPACMDGYGVTPPENVGGSPGYDAFLEIIFDSNHPDYDYYIQWAKSQGYQEFDIGNVNRALKFSLFY